MTETEAKRKAASRKVREWRHNPVQFVRDNFRVEPDAWQVGTLLKLGGGYTPKRQLAMKACTGPGKSALLSWIGWHRLSCFADHNEHPKGAALSGQGRDNLRDNLWSELAKWQNLSPFLTNAFTWTKEQIFAKGNPQTWFLSARSYAQNADTEAIGRSLSGLHSKFPFVLLDEIGDMPITVGQKASQIFTGSPVDALIGAAGNPTSTTGLLYQICKSLPEAWDIVTITADPDDPKRTPRVDKDYALEQIKLYGKDNPWVMATILGEFPPEGINALLGPDVVMQAMNRHLTEDQYEFAQMRIGVDVARFGDDRNILFPRQGLVAFPPIVLRNMRTDAIAARVMVEKKTRNSEMEFIDGTGGYGAGVIDSLITAGESPSEINFSGKAIDPRYYNKRAEMWFEMANWIKRGGSIPNDPELMKELTAPLYYFQGGKFRLEEKDQIKKRLGYSPDKADALALTFALPDMPRTMESIAGIPEKRGKLRADYDPFAENRT